MSNNFERPSVTEILLRVKSDIEGAIAGVSAQLWETTERGLAEGVTGVADTLHGHIAWAADQIIPSESMAERILLRFGEARGIIRKDATQAQRSITVTGTGGDMPAGTQWLRQADGYIWTVDANVDDITSEPALITAAASSVTRLGGALGNLEVGEVLKIVAPIADVNSTATVIAAPTTDFDGSNLETIGEYLERVLDYLREPPRGGAPGDFEKWALEVPGVTRAWEFVGVDGTGNPGIGRVALCFMRDNDPVTIPDADAVQVVQDYIDARFFGERAIVFAPTAEAFDYTVALTPNTSAVQNAVQDVNGAAAEGEVPDMLRRDAIPGGTIYLSRLNEAISAARGETRHTLVSPTVDKVHAFGVIAVPGTRAFS